MANLTLVLGGAASGKSLFAEGLVSRMGLRKHYIATAQAFDDEMTAKIAIHRGRRGDDWRLSEAPLEPAATIRACGAGEILLLDCATLWLGNTMLAERDIVSATEELLNALAGCRNPIVIVSNETGMSIVPEHKLGREFREAQGMLNQRLAEVADTVVLVVAGLPMVLKGVLP